MLNLQQDTDRAANKAKLVSVKRRIIFYICIEMQLSIVELIHPGA